MPDPSYHMLRGGVHHTKVTSLSQGYYGETDNHSQSQGHSYGQLRITGKPNPVQVFGLWAVAGVLRDDPQRHTVS